MQQLCAPVRPPLQMVRNLYRQTKLLPFLHLCFISHGVYLLRPHLQRLCIILLYVWHQDHFRKRNLAGCELRSRNNKEDDFDFICVFGPDHFHFYIRLDAPRSVLWTPNLYVRLLEDYKWSSEEKWEDYVLHDLISKNKEKMGLC